ncbi:MAG: DMT family transporter [Evtepia sp.]
MAVRGEAVEEGPPPPPAVFEKGRAGPALSRESIFGELVRKHEPSTPPPPAALSSVRPPPRPPTSPPPRLWGSLRALDPRARRPPSRPLSPAGGRCAFAFDGGMPLGAATPTVWGIIVYMAIGCTVAGYLLQNAALGHISPLPVALLQCICPVLTALFSRILLDERLSLLGMVGAVIILLCVAAETLMKDDE